MQKICRRIIFILALQELGCHRSRLKSGKICLEPPQMKCNEQPQEAELMKKENSKSSMIYPWTL
jgi:hypothetical protein